MSIQVFNDPSLPDMLCYFNAAGDSVVTAPGGIVSSVTDGYGGALTAVPRDGTEHIYHDGTTGINNCPAFYDDGTGGAQGLVIDVTPAYDEVAGGLTIVMLEQRNQKNNGQNSFETSGAGGRSMRVRRNGEDYSFNVTDKSITTSSPIEPNAGIVIVARHIGTTDSAQFKTDRETSSWESVVGGAALQTALNKIVLFNEDGANDALRGRIAIFCAYKGTLDDTQVGEVIDLMHHWQNEGSAPTPSLPEVTSITPSTQTVQAPAGFTLTASVTGDPAPTLQWSTNASGSYQDIPGATSSNYTADSTAPDGSDTGTYKLIATNASGPGENAATVTVTPQGQPDTSATFGPVATVDKSATLQWLWSTAEAGQPWNDIDGATPLPATIQWSLSDGVQKGNQLNIDSATAVQVVYLRCKATTSYEPGGIFSSINTLTIVEES